MSCLLSLGTKDSDNTPILQNILGHKKRGDRGIYHKFNSASILLQIKRVNEVI